VTGVAPAALGRVEQVMGMPVAVDVRDVDVDPAAVDELFAWLRAVDERFSTYKHTSEVSRVNRGELRLDEAHPDVAAIYARCEELRLETNGYFDMRAASEQPDPSGLVKGWAVGRAAEILDAAGARNYAVDAGGDILVRCGALPERTWRIGIQHPLVAGSLAAVVEATELAIATSGEYNRGRHVFDPHTRRPPSGVLWVTVVGPNLGVADAYATPAFAMGAAAPRWTARLRGCDAMTILADEQVFSTAGFPRAS